MVEAYFPPALAADLVAAGDDDAKAESIGVCQCVAQAAELLQRDVPDIQFYVLNKSSHRRRIIEQLRPLTPPASCRWDTA